MSDPGCFWDEAVATLNELLYLAVGRHPSSSSSSAPALTPQPYGPPLDSVSVGTMILAVGYATTISPPPRRPPGTREKVGSSG
jgi:hypothetical protein